MMRTNLIILGSILLVQTNSQQHFCDSALECDFYPGDLVTSGSLYCTASQSCGWRNIDVGTSITCDGAFSCYSILTASVGALAYCFGLQSCKNIYFRHLDGSETITDYPGPYVLECSGSNTCQNTNHSAEQSFQIAQVICSGENSCYGARINSVKQIDAKGSFSISNSVITSGGGDLIVNIYGFLAGNNATIYCKNNDLCYINCFGNGCMNTQVICDVTPNCIINCDIYSSENNICADKININLLPATEHINIFDPSFTSYDDLILNMLTQSLSKDISTYFYQICTDYSSNSDTSGIQSCANEGECSSSTTLTNLDNSDYNSDNVQGLCCSGLNSCLQAEITGNNEKSQFIACIADLSCSEATININNIDDSMYWSEVYCEGKRSCMQSIISNGSTVHCGGSLSCSETNITNVINLICSGDESCTQGQFSDVSIIYASGYDALRDSNIILGSKLLRSTSKRVFTMHFLGYGAGLDTRIICQSDSYCNIVCGIYGACHRSTVVECLGECNVTCQFANRTLCPTVIDIMTNETTTTSIATTATMTTANATARTDTTTELDSQDSGVGNVRNTMEDDLESLQVIYRYVFYGLGSLFLFALVFGTLDAYVLRKNELYKWSSVSIFGAYTLDFVSGIYFLWLLSCLGCILFLFFSLLSSQILDLVKPNVKLQYCINCNRFLFRWTSWNCIYGSRKVYGFAFSNISMFSFIFSYTNNS